MTLVDRLSREELYDLVWSEPISKIAPRFGVSDVWIGKVCRGADVPLPPRGYWAKVQSGKTPQRSPLPPLKPGASNQVILRRLFSRKRPSISTNQVKAAMASAAPVPVPSQLRRPHQFVAATRQRAEAAKPQEDGRIYLGAQRDTFQLHVSRGAVGRALRILQAVCDESLRRGWRIDSRPAWRTREAPIPSIVIGNQVYEVSIEERTEAIPFTDEDIRRWQARRSPWETRDQPRPSERRKRPTGELALLIPSSWDGNRSRWADGKRSRLEEKLAEFFATLEVRAVQDEEQARQRQREQQEREAQALRSRIERARAERLEREVAASEQADRIRRYVAKVRARLGDLAPAKREQLAAWCDWAAVHADGLDPATNIELIKGFDDERDGIGW